MEVNEMKGKVGAVRWQSSDVWSPQWILYKFWLFAAQPSSGERLGLVLESKMCWAYTVPLPFQFSAAISPCLCVRADIFWKVNLSSFDYLSSMAKASYEFLKV